MALITGSILVLMWILGHDFSGHYNRLALITVDIISGVYCSYSQSTHSYFIRKRWMMISIHDVVTASLSLSRTRYAK